MGPGNRPLDLEWLEDFLSLAESGNFSRAAEARRIAQPAFSRHIRALEEWVGVDLFDRSAHPTALTAAGKRIHPLLEDVLAGLEAARIKARIAHDLSAASLRFAATHVLSVTFFPAWLATMEAQLHLGPIQTMSDSAQACEDLMLQRRVQFVLCHGHAIAPSRLDEAQYPMRVLGQDVLAPVCAPDGTGKLRYTTGQSEPPPLLAYSEVSGLGRIMRAQSRSAFAHIGEDAASGRANVVFTAHHAILLKAMALAGRGIAWLPLSLIGEELANGTLMHAGDEAWRMAIEIRLYRQPADMAPAAENLWQLTRDGVAPT
ncbi:LysR family transcriptional regulator [Schauerella aestuarii]|uniref:LysR family transcriptional regulator n=1 Tax=Schauerella aestuarii TaxID=2511204 RepID=UPI00136F80B4|nr:LysR family transcriptional regulator [Achromobacter aestuarii]MYZ45882.1 LysR family transcriptional regulator [Achromobacter aestuarii]